MNANVKYRCECRKQLHLLQAAARDGDLTAVGFLENYGARDFGDRTPISIAARCGKSTIVKFLARHGADLETRDNYGSTPLSLAAVEGHVDIVEFLKEVMAQRQRQTASAVGNFTKSAVRR